MDLPSKLAIGAAIAFIVCLVMGMRDEGSTRPRDCDDDLAESNRAHGQITCDEIADPLWGHYHDSQS